MAGVSIDSAFIRRSTLSKYVAEGITDLSVINQLIVDGRAINDEAVLWDFKRELPCPPKLKLNDSLRNAYDCKLAEIVKDAVAFYNTYGGYLVVGVDDASRSIIGFDGEFDAADLNKRIQGATGANIETIYRLIEMPGAGSSQKLGLLFIPRRPEKVRPAQFKKPSPENPNGKQAYRQNDFFFRERDNCKPAISSEELEFLYGPRLIDEPYRINRAIENNLPARDVDLARLIGRDAELAQLWAWLADTFSPVKILAGVGGVGKTSIAYTFAERLIYQAPPYIDRVVWLGAKAETFSLHANKPVPTIRVDYRTIDELLTQMLLQTGCHPDQIPEQPSRDELLNLAQEHLSAFSYLLFIDNIDTLADEEQQLVFHLLMQLCSTARAKAVLTARRNLGASRTAYIEVEGLDYADFQDFVIEKCDLLKLRPPIEKDSVAMKDFFGASGGSPLFALSILRLLVLGDSFRDAIQNWRGSDGETVRDAAFGREVGRLKANEAKVLLVLCYLEQASALQIASILGITRYDVQKALEELQTFSMTAVERSLPGGATFKIPETLSLVTSLVEKRVSGWKEIKEECKKHREIAANKAPFVADAIMRTLSQLKAGELKGALDIAQAAVSALPENQDLQCLLGRVYAARSDEARADDAYQKAYDLGCRKRILIDGWIEVRESREDWQSVISIAEIGEKEFAACRYSITKCKAMMMIGDELSRAGKYKEAEKQYEAAIEDIRNALRTYSYQGDRVNLWKMNESLVIRWLGAIRMLGTQSDDHRRVFGACHKAISTYRFVNDQVLRSALGALSAWIDKVSVREVISDTAREQLEQAIARLQHIQQIVSAKGDVSDIVTSRFLAEANAQQRRMEELIKSGNRGSRETVRKSIGR